MISKHRKKNGDIFEVPLLPHINAYAYFKYIDVTKYLASPMYPDAIIIYSDLHHANITSNREIKDRDMLLNTVYITGGSGISKLFRFVGKENIFKEELFFPPIRHGIPWGVHDPQATGWDVKNIQGQVILKNHQDFQQINRIDSLWGVVPIEYIPFRIAIELQKTRCDIALDTLALDWYQKGLYEMSAHMPVYDFKEKWDAWQKSM